MIVCATCGEETERRRVVVFREGVATVEVRPAHTLAALGRWIGKNSKRMEHPVVPVRVGEIMRGSRSNA